MLLADLGTDGLLELAQRAGFPSALSLVVKVIGEASPSLAVAADRYLYPASMIKTPLVAAAFCDVEAGRLSLRQRVTVTAANLTFDDAPSPLVTGYEATLEQIAELAISKSDNVATNMLFDLVGRDRATEIARDRLGLAATAFYRKLSGSDPLIDDPGWDGVHRNAHSAHDAALLFERIAIDAVPAADDLRAALSRQVWNDKLSRGLRDGDRFAHKTGDTQEVTHDGGILTTAEGRTYVIVVYTGWGSTDAHNACFGAFMQTLRPYL